MLALAAAGYLHVLRDLFTKVTIPYEVVQEIEVELRNGRACIVSFEQYGIVIVREPRDLAAHVLGASRGGPANGEDEPLHPQRQRRADIH